MSLIDISSDLPEGTALLNDLTTTSSNVYNNLKGLSDKISNKKLCTDKGLSLLELKNQLYLSYLSNLLYTTLLKLSGLSLQGNSSVDRLVELRVILERIRPLEDKMKHQIQKYVKAASKDTSEASNTVNMKNNLENIDYSSDEEEDATTEDKDENQLYKIPKITQMHYPGELEKEDNRQKRERSRALSSSMLRDALYEHTEDPEVFHNMGTLKQKSIEKRNQIERYEEDNFTRLTLSKKEKAAINQIATPGTIGKDLLSFRSLDGFEGHEERTSSDRGKKRKQNKSLKKKKGFKKRKKH